MPKPDELVDMRLTGADRNTVGSPSIERQEYSYGLVLRLEKPELKKLEMNRLPQVGDEYQIIAKGKVSNVYESQSEGNREDRAVQIQITHLAVK
jgi:hypothetical protein